MDPLVEPRGVLLVPNVRGRVLVLDGRRSSVGGMVVPLVDEGPGEKGEQKKGPGNNVSHGSLEVLGVGNERNRVFDKGVNVGLDGVPSGILGLSNLRETLGTEGVVCPRVAEARSRVEGRMAIILEA